MKRSRLERVIQNMKILELPQILISESESIEYLLGRGVLALERVGILLIKENGEMHMFANRILCFKPVEGVVLHEHDDGDLVYREIARELLPGKVGFDKNLLTGHTIGILKERSDLIPEIGSQAVDRARMVKDQDEKNALRASGALNDRAVAFGISNISESLKEADLSNKIENFFLAEGSEPNPYPQLVCYGKTAADPHHLPDQTVLQPGDAVLFDLFSHYHGYWCDMTRTVFYRSVSDHQREIYEIVRRAQQAAIDSVKPGVKMGDIDAAARNVIADAGYGEFFITRTGHGAGLTIHEAPFCMPGSRVTAEPGMVFSIEPGIYIEGDIGIRIEDLVLVTEEGCEVLTKYPKELQVIG